VPPLNEQIKSYITRHFGEENLNHFTEFLNSTPAQYLRVNPLKISAGKLSEILSEKYGIKTELLNNIPFALKVIKNNRMTGKTIEHILGYYYIQGLSSMLPPAVLNPASGDIVLDLCAAPGSKTTQLAELMNNKGTLIANEIQLSRVKALVHNIERMNVINTGVLHKKGELLSKVYANYFDKILIDAPCSGLGIIQKKEEISLWWSENKVKALTELQTRLLIAAVKMCKPGGEIVYSTCTLTKEENEDVINKVLSKYPVEAMEIDLPVYSHTPVKNAGSPDEILKGKRIFPWETDSDGFFIIKLTKTDETESPDEYSKKQSNYIKLLPFDHRDIRIKLKRISDNFGISEKVFKDYRFIVKSNNIHFAASEWTDDDPGMFNRIGLKLGSVDKKDDVVLNTHAAQILSNHITEKIILLPERNELKTYLEGGIIKNDSFNDGQYIIKYEDYILGTAVVTKAGIKSRFPRSKRTQEIYTDF
jgi:16S rRNA (cytosine1407-C5)-methyltransferase